jgi:hypothetical protein
MENIPAYSSESEGSQYWAAYPKVIQEMAIGVFNAPAETPVALRQAVEAYTARLAGGKRKSLPIPENLEEYLRKVGLYAYKVVDEDIDALKTNGYSESAIYELSIAVALGAGLARVERVLTLLDEEDC